MTAQGNEGRLGKRIAIVIGVAAAGVMALGTQTAAALPHYHTAVTINHIDSCCVDRSAGGRVSAEVRKCLSGRKVVLFEQRPGADRRLGKDRSAFIHGAHHQSAQWWIAARASRAVACTPR